MESDIIKNNLKIIQKRINRACDLSNRNKNEVKLLLATKTVSVENIQFAIDEGYSLLGENKVMEAMEKYEVLKENRCEWHIIGHLQTNKIKYALKFADVIQSVDRIKLANKLQNRCEYDGRNIDIFIQVNTSFEKSKFGIAPERAIEFIKQVSEFPRLHIKGLMTIGLLSSQDEKVRDCFKLLKEIQLKSQALELPNASFDELSMGMSNDLELAIEEGSTMIRVGTAIFGQRPFPDSYYWNERN
ncbi:YggS family pyridoxal phosphate-dependent enzyme [Aequorivita sp. H23M31]|uniref:Pyridoxal phosphate homeostasis protein n=1 Tax=Aequorivita ciconiae TaxID=2494375 RepID=A0A410G7L6_9FLAO|nr:YggS family pyridoxal phosphate-dependent enzyme [Aequorivita sp. H23M31]QAA83252.1 YggS family pyridoxal phosphate-dependent enzyme [Aequorivita sp. H23M31]